MRHLQLLQASAAVVVGDRRVWALLKVAHHFRHLRRQATLRVPRHPGRWCGNLKQQQQQQQQQQGWLLSEEEERTKKEGGGR